MRIIGIIPARYQSSRLEGKPLVDLHGKTMIERTYLGSRASRAIETLIVATDDERIYNEVRRFNGDVEMTSRSHASGTDRIAEVAARRNFDDGDIIVNIQGDQPLIEASTIDSMVKPLIEDGALLISTMSYRIRDESEIDNPSIVKVVTDLNGMALYFSRYAIPFLQDGGAVDKPRIPYYKHLGLYAYRKSFLLQFAKLPHSYLEKCEKLEQLRALENGYRIKVIESDYDSLEIDTPEDLERFRQFLKKSEVDA